MDNKLLLNDLADLLNEPVENLNNDYVLQGNSLWDSLTFVSTIALIDQYYNLSVKGSEIESCQTIGDLVNIITTKDLNSTMVAAMVEGE